LSANVGILDFSYVNLVPQIETGNLYDTVLLTPSWEMSISFYLQGTVSDGASIVHLTKSDRYERHPSIRFQPGSYELAILYSQGCQERSDWYPRMYFTQDYGWKTGEYHTLKLIAEKVDGDLTASDISIFIDGVFDIKLEYKNLCFGRESKLYISSPWAEAANIGILDFSYVGQPN